MTAAGVTIYCSDQCPIEYAVLDGLTNAGGNLLYLHRFCRSYGLNWGVSVADFKSWCCWTTVMVTRFQIKRKFIGRVSNLGDGREHFQTILKWYSWSEPKWVEKGNSVDFFPLKTVKIVQEWDALHLLEAVTWAFWRISNGDVIPIPYFSLSREKVNISYLSYGIHGLHLVGCLLWGLRARVYIPKL